MPTWSEFERQFRELEGALKNVRLDHQWGAAGEHWRLAGPADTYALERFETLAAQAGQKLTKEPILARRADITKEPDPGTRWYRACVTSPSSSNQVCMAGQVKTRSRANTSLQAESTEWPKLLPFYA